MNSSLSIRSKIHLTLGVIFLSVLVVVVSIAVSAEKELSREMIEEKLQDTATSYLDTLNMLMVSGAIGNRELVRTKLLSDNNIIEARVMRAPIVDKYYNRGFDHEYPVDELDRRALNGEEVLVSSNDSNGHTMTYVMPVLAYKDYRGTDCITCHFAQENEILGAIRISYSLDSLDQNIFNNMLKMGLVQAAMFILGLIILSLMLRRLVIMPVKTMHTALTSIEQNSDLTLQVHIESNDEIGQTSNALNTMTRRFADSLRQVVELSAQLQDCAAQIDQSSRASLHAAEAQKSETLDIQQSITDLRGSTQQVVNNASDSSQASNAAKEVAKQGVTKTDLAANSIQTMNEALQSASDVISTLDERSKNVGSVLGVIKGIAEQTNLLALNAAIEAARAGESGRGFAVVADEVRTLSQRTAESTQEIERMIAQLQHEAHLAVESMSNAQVTANDGMERVREAANALYSMAEQVEHMDDLNTQTLDSMNSQVSISQQVDQGIESISRYSTSSADMAKQTNEVVKLLVAMANDLTQLVNRFRV